jgi:hypothetical protein
LEFERKIQLLGSREASNLFSIHEPSPLLVFPGQSFDQILNQQIPKEHLKIGLLLEIIQVNLRDNQIKFCDYDCHGCEIVGKDNWSCKSYKFPSLRLGYSLCASKHAFHIEANNFDIPNCPVCQDEEIAKSLKKLSGQILSLLGYLKDRKLEVQKEFDSSCEIKARTYDEAVKQMAKKNPQKRYCLGRSH